MEVMYLEELCSQKCSIRDNMVGRRCLEDAEVRHDY